jgi:hypothetical protein
MAAAPLECAAFNPTFLMHPSDPEARGPGEHEGLAGVHGSPRVLDSSDVDGIGIGGVRVHESGTPPSLKFHPDRRRSRRMVGGVQAGRKAGIFMLTTVNPLAPGTYFEQQAREFP